MMNPNTKTTPVCSGVENTHMHQMTGYLREKLRDPEFMKTITQGAVIPAGQTDAQVMERLLEDEQNASNPFRGTCEEDETLPFEDA